MVNVWSCICDARRKREWRERTDLPSGGGQDIASSEKFNLSVPSVGGQDPTNGAIAGSSLSVLKGKHSSSKLSFDPYYSSVGSGK